MCANATPITARKTHKKRLARKTAIAEKRVVLAAANSKKQRTAIDTEREEARNSKRLTKRLYASEP